jgi:hypothetical protein
VEQNMKLFLTRENKHCNMLQEVCTQHET